MRFEVKKRLKYISKGKEGLKGLNAAFHYARILLKAS
jgi:hypothetical protein